MDVWLTFFAVVAGGGLLVFLFLRRNRRRDAETAHSPDEAPPLRSPADGARPRGPRP